MPPKVMTLTRGALVEAVAVPSHVCDAKPGDRGVVFEEASYFEPGTGPMVRWTRNGHACNVYENWVKVILV